MPCHNWIKCTVSDCAEVRSGGTPATGNPRFWNGGIPWVTPSEVSKAGKYLEATVSSISKEGLDNSSAELLPINTVVMCSRATIGPRAILKVPMTTNQGFKNFICKDNLDPEFWYYYLDVVIPSFLSCASGNTFKEVSKRDVEQTTVRLPPLSEQHRITAILSASDRVVESKQKLLDSKKGQKRALMRMLLEPNSEDAAFSRVGGGTRPGGRIPHVGSKLISFADCFDALRNNTYSRAVMTPTAGIANIHYGDVLVKYGEVLDFSTADVPSLLPGTTAVGDELRNGDIVIADTAEDETCGRTVEIANLGSRKAVAGLHTIACRPKPGLFVPGWLGNFMNSVSYHRQLVPLMAGIKVLSISRTALKGTTILVPTISKQRRTVAVLSAADREIDGLAREIDAWKEKRKALSQLLLSGKVRV